MPDLYRMYGRGNRLLYVGVSFNAGTRATQHATDKAWWSEVSTITVEHLTGTWEDALALEKRTIWAEKPLYNKQHNTGDEYVPRTVVKPLAVPSELRSSREWRAVQRALVHLAASVRRQGMPTLVGSLGGVDLLALLEAQARTAHLPLPCNKCGGDTAAYHLTLEAVRDPTCRCWSVCLDEDCPGGNYSYITLEDS
jgi:hypothetical protein